MAEAPISLFRSFTDVLRGILPPPPTAIYSTNAILAKEVVNVPHESYFAGCTPFWWVVASEKNALSAFADYAKKNNLMEEQLHVLREKLLQSCAAEGVGSGGGDGNHQSQCPFPTYDIVIDMSQVYCGGFFHWEIEIWPRIAPFLDGLLSDDMPNFAIRIGCNIKDFHPKFFGLMGLKSPKFTLIGIETVFAKEVIMPTEGFAHTPLGNYWNLVSLRRHVEKRIGSALISGSGEQMETKRVLVLVRDASRRGDEHIYNKQFFQQLSVGLGPGYNVTAYRSSDSALMGCLECQVREFMAADVIIGSHGAGLSHLLFAKRGGTVLERIVSPEDSSIYAQLPFMFGLKYFSMASDAGWEAYRDIIQFASDV